MSNEPIKQVAHASLTNLLFALKNEVFATMNCCKVGKINKFDKVRKCAEIQLMLKKVTSVKEKKIVSYPLLIECPVFTLQGAQSSLQMPIKKGDTCLVFFSDRNLDIWWRTDEAAAPADHRCHSISDGIAIVGINSLKSQLPAYTDDVVLTVTPGQNFIINQPRNVLVNGQSGQDFTINGFQRFTVQPGQAAYVMGMMPLALLWELNALIQLFNTHSHPYPNPSVPGTTLPPMTLSQPAQGTKKLFGS